VVLIATGAGSTGGLTALLAKKLRAKTNDNAATGENNGKEHGDESTARSYAK
jgi:hypothetical protein